MCVDHHTGGNSIRRAEDDIGRLATDAGKLHEGVEILGNLALVFVDQFGAAGLDVLRLVAIEARAFDRLFNLGERRGGEIGRSFIFFEQVLADDVDSFVGTLGRENCGDQQLERRLMN